MTFGTVSTRRRAPLVGGGHAPMSTWPPDETDRDGYSNAGVGPAVDVQRRAR